MPMNATQLEEYLLINVALKGERKHSALHLKRGQWKRNVGCIHLLSDQWAPGVG